MHNILKKAYSIKEYIIKIRRELHKHPELAFREEWTHDFIGKELKNLGLSFRTLNKTGIVSDIGDGNGRTALRCDMDALPIEEENDIPYSSENEGRMHACGHDTHMAMILGAARLMIKNRIEKPVRLIFQPSEERTPGGASGMIEEGVLDGVSEIYGLHIMGDIEIGKILLKPGAMMAAADEMDIILRGGGGHASEPDRTEDVIYASSLLINQIQGLVSRKSDPRNPIVISICSIHGGTSYNIFPTEVEIKGTARTVDYETWKNVPEWIGNILKSLRISYNIDYELSYNRGYPVLENDRDKVSYIESIAGKIFNEVKIMEKPVMGGEDFAYYLEKIPGAFIFLGAANKQKGINTKLHTPDFMIDEDALPMGSALLYSIVDEKVDN